MRNVGIAEMPAWFQNHRIPEAEAQRTYERLGLSRWEIPVEPQVVEIAFDVVHRSSAHERLCLALPAHRALAPGQSFRIKSTRSCASRKSTARSSAKAL
ncbi:MAG: hypothetical protein ACRENA_05660 [Vulcanimicrobiaceae bacterium]